METTIYQLKFWIVVFLSFANVFIFYQLFFLLKGFQVVKYKKNISCVRLEAGAKISRGYNYRFSTAEKFQLRGQLKF